MNYYKQGDAANAEQIRAAFEKLGYTTAGFNFKSDKGVYYTDRFCKSVDFVSAPAIVELIKTHPDYQELELPVEPKFKVGDWIVQNDNGTVSQITKTINGKDEYGEYSAYEHTNGYFAACFENEYHLWTMADAKDGDVLFSRAGCPFIFRKDRVDAGGYHNIIAHCGITTMGSFIECSDRECWTYELPKPATKEQRDLLFAKMKDAGYEWDADKKELRKIKPHYNIANFHAGMPVLVRETSLNAWQYVLFSHCYIGGDGLTRFNAGLVGFTQCIPYNDDTKHLLGTTDPCEECYINW